jgi:signal peptidase I
MARANTRQYVLAFAPAFGWNHRDDMDTEAAPPSDDAPGLMRFIVGRNPGWTLVRILFLVLISLVLFKFVLVPIRVTGESMFPTCRNGQIKFVNRLAYLRHKPRRGDIVAVEYQGPKVLLLKRIIGLPGETFQVLDGDIYIDGAKLIEPYVNGKIPAPDNKGYGSSKPIPLGRTEYMVVGDNRTISEGYIKDENQILGKIL